MIRATPLLAAALVAILLGTSVGASSSTARGPHQDSFLSGENGVSSHGSAQQSLAMPAATGLSWVNISNATAPSPRHSAAMAYDAADGYVLLFGGYTHTGQTLGDTWTFHAGTWSQITGVRAPHARFGASMVYDPASRQIVLFGGGSGSGVFIEFNDTWGFHGGRWTNLSHTIAIAPPARAYASMAYDTAAKGSILFGGSCLGYCTQNDTWKFAGGVWQNVTSASVKAPSARYGAAMTYDTADRELVLFGGSPGLCAPTCAGSDTWVYRSGHWTHLPASGPSARYTGLMIYDGASRTAILFGGWDGVNTPFPGDTWEFSAGTWTLLTASGPSGRTSFGFAYDASDGYALLFGGFDSHTNTIGDTWELA